MKIRRIPFNLKKAMNIGSNFNFNWAFDKETSILGLGYSFYLEHIEYFCNFVSKNYRSLIKDTHLLEKEKNFLAQEMHHARYHKELNSFLCKNILKGLPYHPRIYDFYLETHNEIYSHLSIGVANKEYQSIEDSLKKIAVFESKNCISSFVFFDNFFSNKNFKKTLKASQNLGILYLLAYHFTEEIEHCDIAVDIYQEISGNSLWNKKNIEDEILNLENLDREPLVAAIYCAKKLNINLEYNNLINSPFIKLTRNQQIKSITQNFNLNSPEILEKRKKIIYQWDNEWEPILRAEIESQISLTI